MRWRCEGSKSDGGVSAYQGETGVCQRIRGEIGVECCCSRHGWVLVSVSKGLLRS